MTVTIWHNPRCSKSRATLEILQERGIEPTIITYLDTAPSTAEIKNALTLLGMDSARDMMRKGETEYQQHHLDNTALSEEALIQAMNQYPRLIERPIVFSAGQASIGRPPESVLDIIDDNAS
ncbi:MAG: arsenate reductase (glutaredoxin) [Xanthomonadales bacterium]|nr:arsenate reductase (glutaredoxin) [Xanthomonadales bacterium]